MKKIFFTLALLLLTCSAFFQKIIENPDYGLGNLIKIQAINAIEIVNCKLKGKINRGTSRYLILVTERDNPFQSGVKSQL